ncbi:MAG: hypothetical protein KJ566_01660 [Nanoarchaeota archaeon]|nr:hypothetical protein [Nanoarchaeota archaeon]
MNNERQVRYNYFRSEEFPEAIDWFFLIINQNREIREIEQKIYDLIHPVFNPIKEIKGQIKGNDLRYKLIGFSSFKSIDLENLKKVYKRIIKDNHLYTRQTVDGLENYLRDHLEK